MERFFEQLKEAVLERIEDKGQHAEVTALIESAVRQGIRLRLFRERALGPYREQQAEVRALWKRRWGTSPSGLEEMLESAPRRRAHLLYWLIEQAESPEEFWRGLRVCESALMEARFEGARQLFTRLLEQRFGPLDPDASELLHWADRSSLTACFARFNAASSQAEVVEPLQAMLDSPTPPEVLGE